MKKNNQKIKNNLIILFVVIALIISVALNIYLYIKISNVELKTYSNPSISSSVKKVYDSVVTIQNYRNSKVTTSGTGFIYKKDIKNAYIITNEHVIRDNEKIGIVLSNDKEIEATLLGKDEYLDLAVLKINTKYAKSTVTIGNSELVNLGDTVFTIGSPLGYDYRGSVTVGVLSGKDRLVKTTANTDEDWIMKVLQIDASINHGNSGGPLLNVNGEVIGICTLKITDDDIEGMGFAIPIEYAMNSVDALEKGEKIKWPELGIKIVNVNESATVAKNDITIPSEIEDGVVITNIDKKSNVSSILKKGDIITKINNNSVKDIAEFKYELYKYTENDIIKITYIRNNKEKTSKIKIKSSN